MRILFIAFSILLLFQNPLSAQIQKDSIDGKKLRNIILAESTLYAAGMTGLGFLWYKDNESQSFQFFNDNNQWLQMDKVGHLYTAYHLTNINYLLLKNAGMRPKKAMLYSSISSTAMMLPIEIFDGFSTSYGASWGDALANIIGAFLPYQQFLFDQNYINPKFSFSQSRYAHLRPNTLGKNYIEQLIKDYNGQTYWLSTDFNIFSKENKFPNWLQFSIGYSGNQMVYGNPFDNLENGYYSNRQWLLSMDLNFEKIKVEQQWLKIILKVINKVKIPFPAVEWNGKDVVLHPLYF
ncbi:DUF2279 domain-containing protein [Marivirga tractuosa]|uniref:DUF2279 domain-containing protein n=1 Tax=Marivirga tractuosa (strain ATCC 23168 / DSM 4126 / NBRC 15989 / NCIMB 1408 / VKM B-1430 / H-43) TaxID=643867 RepID=E4TVD8_MARTH|nr:DUF2279 domain-containing protein [Marivirga tractuosa]ADR20070.1 hypothetical protein Ftrac_0053 [Marivirga tractuosa DSM 4126]BDD15498.1 DUF2279 domain-containing protein [Marivirga tractuosa]